MAESLCCAPETLPTLLIHYTMIQNKKFKKTTKKESLWKNSDNKNKGSLTIRISIIILSSLLNWEISTFISNDNLQEIPHTEEHIKQCHEKFNQQNDLVPSINKLQKKKWQMRTLKMQRFRRHVNQSNVRTLFGSDLNKQTSLFYFSVVSFVFPQSPLPNEPSAPNPTSQGLL